MNKTLRWKLILMAFLIVISAFLVLPSFYPKTPDWFKKYIYSEGLKLGLDLQGGMHLILKVDVEKAVKNSLELSATDLKDYMSQKSVTIVRLKSSDPQEAVFALPNKDAIAKLEDAVKQEFHNLKIKEIDKEERFPKVYLALNPDEENYIRDHAVDQSLEIIRNRIDQFGVTEPVIVRQGEEDIVVQLPGVKDPERAMKLIGQTAQLEFKLVDDEPGVDLGRLIAEAIKTGRLPEKYDAKDLNTALKGLIPRDDKVYILKDEERETGKVTKTPMLLKEKTLMTGDAVKTAHVRIGQYNEPYVGLDLTGRGSKLFEKITEENVGKRLAIVLDDVVRSAPVIRERIPGGHAQISGRFTHEEASDLAIVLRAGSLPAPVKIIQNVTVGPSLGRDSIQKGLMAGLIGAAAVLFFMVFYYRFSGVISDFAMVLNILFLMAVLSLFHATLTLPGIAGIILTIGMGVDSNVLIYERMREEKAIGKSLKGFIDSGYDKAFWSIVDAHVTTLITAFALFLFGTGPIKGFAVTLSAGIIINLFTAIYGTRFCYDWLFFKHSIKDLSFLQIVKKTYLDFIGRRKVAFGISGVLIALGLLAFSLILAGKANLGVDFAGGSMIQYKAEQPFTLNKIRTAMENSGIEGYTLQDVPGSNVFIVRVKQSEVEVARLEERISEALSKYLPEYKFTQESIAEIGSTVSKDLRNKALIAIAISLAGILSYLAYRFNISFGVAAAAATFHDVLAVLGLLYVFGVEINLLIVTALLTIAGYSLTDTVVVFDRIRENIRHSRGAKFFEIINKSVNDMMGRTIITSLTTLLVVLCLYFFGGVVIHDFALAMFFGVIIGTYSSVFVASPIVYLWHKGKMPKT